MAYEKDKNYLKLYLSFGELSTYKEIEIVKLGIFFGNILKRKQNCA